MTPIEDRLAATVRCGVIHSGDDQERLIAHKQAAEAVAEIERLRAGHCTDCCCAQSWKALGIDEYTGKSIPEEITHVREWMIKNRDVATELQYQLDDATKEIEQLRAECEAVPLRRNEIINKQVARIEELEADVLQKSILCDSIAENCNGLRNRAWKAEARIEELETGLKKERSARLLEKSGSILLAYLKENEIDFDRFFDGKAQEQLQAEGKIGTSDQFPDTTKLIWQITEERKNALRFSISGEMSPTCSCKYCKDAIATIRAMLEGAGV